MTTRGEVGNGPERLNVDAEPGERCTPAEWRLAAELNRNDLRLYEYGLALFDRQRVAAPR